MTKNTFYTAPALIELTEGEKEFSFIEILREMDAHVHPVYGKMKVTGDMLAEMKSNFDAGVRRIFEGGAPQVDIDYDHKKDAARGNKAAGWIKALKLVEKTLNNGKKIVSLWAQPDWTPEAQAAIKNGEYKYFSAEFQNEYKEPEQNKVFKNVLLGGGLTNRPYVKELAPLTLAENLDGHATQTKEDDKMLDMVKDVLKNAGVTLAETVVEADVITALGERLTADAALIADKCKALDEAGAKLAETEKQLAEFTAAKELAEKALTDARKVKILADVAEKLTPAEVKELIEPLFADGKFEYAEKLTAALPKKIKDVAVSDDAADDDETEDMTSSEAVDKKVKAYMEKNGMKANQYREAYNVVMSDAAAAAIAKKIKDGGK